MEELDSGTHDAESDTEGKGRAGGGRLQKTGTGWALSFFQKPVLQ